MTRLSAGQREAAAPAATPTEFRHAPSQKGRVGFYIKLTIATVLIFALFVGDGFGQTAFRRLFEVRPQFVLGLFALSLLMNWVSALKWFLILRSRGANLSLNRLFGAYLVGKFFSNFAPGMVGGDMVRTVIVGRLLGSYAQSAASILLERFTGLFVVLLLTVFTVPALPAVGTSVGLKLSVVGIVTVAVATALLVFFDPAREKILNLISRLPGGGYLVTKLQRLHSELAQMAASRGTLFAALALSVVFYALASVSLYLSSLAISTQPDPVDIAVATPAVYLVTAIPVSMNNIGWWEWIVGLFLHQAGLSIAAGVAVGLLMRGVSLCVSLIGGAIFAFEKYLVTRTSPEKSD